MVKNVEIERGVHDLCEMMRDYPRDNPEVELETSPSTSSRHYAKLMYQAILTATKRGFDDMKKRLGSRSSAGFCSWRGRSSTSAWSSPCPR